MALELLNGFALWTNNIDPLKNDIDPLRFLTIQQAGDMLRMSHQTVQRLIHRACPPHPNREP